MKRLSFAKGSDKVLFANLQRLMKEKMPYTDPKLTRKSLASQLGTNENYLYFMLIEAFPDESFTEYIGRLRLDHAKRLLKEFPDAKIEYISLDSGFRSRQTFYRLFKKRFGVTPLEYRNGEGNEDDAMN